MRVLLLSPSVPPEATGNSATAGRLQRTLAAMGVEVSLVRSSDLGSPEGVARRLRDRPADLIHVHHLVKSGRVLLPVPAGGWPPITVSAGGTDLLPLPADDLEVRRRVLELSRRVLVPTEEARRVLGTGLLVPRGVVLGDLPYDLRTPAGCGLGDVLFFLAAGFRHLKRNAFAIGPLTVLRAQGLPVRLAAAGPVLEPDAAERFRTHAGDKDWIRDLGPIPSGCMGAAMAWADVVLNTSVHEGMSNAVLEGMLAGRAVLASDIPGNRAVIRDGETGLLFSTPEAFLEKAGHLARNAALRCRLGTAARKEALRRFSPEAEAAAYLEAWRDALSWGDEVPA